MEAVLRALLLVVTAGLLPSPGVNAQCFNFTSLEHPQSGVTTLYGINDTGHFVGSFQRGARKEGFLFDGTSFVTISFSGATETYLLGINNTGTIVGGHDGAAPGTLVYENGVISTVAIPGGSGARCSDINDAGVIVGYYTDQQGSTHGFVWDGTSLTIVDFPGASFTRLEGISNSGTIVGNYFEGGYYRGFVWDGVSFTPLDAPGSTSTYLTDINNRGEICGQRTEIETANRNAIYYDGSAFIDLDIPGSTGPTFAGSINDAGQICGWFRGPFVPGSGNFSFLGFVADPSNYGSGCAGSGGFVPALTIDSCPVAGSPFQARLSNGLGGQAAWLLFGTSRTALPLLGCLLQIGNVLPATVGIGLSGNGPGQGTGTFDFGTLPSWASGISFTSQAVVLDPAAPGSLTFTNGLALSVR